MKLLSRRLSPKDTDFVLDLEAQCFSVPWNHQQIEFEMTNDHSVFLVALHEEIPCGYGSFRFAADTAYINNIAVTDNMRKQGIGVFLCEKLEEEARSLGLEYITLEVRVSNTPAVSLYKKMGYDTVGVRKNFYSNPCEDAFIMTKKL